ncbi:MAG: hypothetical protein Q9227_006956 [Pyrenula ochraceoflavens]
MQDKGPPKLKPLSSFGKLSAGNTVDEDLEEPQDMNDQERDHKSFPALTEMHHLLTNPKVKGFALQEKAWCKVSDWQREFYVNKISEVTWKKDALDKLVLGDEKKSLLDASGND